MFQGLYHALNKLLANCIACGNLSWLSCSFQDLKKSCPFCFVLVLCMYTQAKGREWGPAECVTMCIKVKAAVEESVMPAQGTTALWAELFLCLVPAEGHDISSDFSNVDK